MPKNHYIIDGLNVCKWKSGETSLALLFSLLNELLQRGETFSCIFDAITRHKLREEDVSSDSEDIYKSILKSFPQYFTEVTGGLQADDLILFRADSNVGTID